MNVRWRKVWSDLWVNKTRTVLMVLTIMVGVFAVGLVGNMSREMNHDMESDYNSSNPSEAKIYVSGVDETWVKSLSRMQGVDGLEGSASLTSQWVQKNGQKVNVEMVAIKSPQEMKLNSVKPVEVGHLLPELKNREVIIDGSAQKLGFIPGEMIKFELPDGRVKELKFAGYVHDPTAFPYGMVGSITAYITFDTAEWMGAQPGYSQLLLSVTGDPTDPEHVLAVAKTLSDRLEKQNVSVYQVFTYNPGHHFAWQITQGVVFVLMVLGWMTVILGAFLITNTIVSLMSQQVRQIGMMKAIGADLSQLMPMYVVLVVCFGAIALAMSVPLAAWGAHGIGGVMATYLNYKQSAFVFFPDVIMQQACVAIVIPLIAALWPLIATVRTPVRVALNNYGISTTSKSTTMKAESHLAYFSRPVLLSLRNAFRRKARVSLTIFTLVLGGAIFIAVFNLWSGFGVIMDSIQSYFMADINVTFTQGYRLSRVADVATNIPGVEKVEGWLEYGATILSKDEERQDEVLVIAPPADSTVINPTIVEGRWLTPMDKNAIVIGNQLLLVRPELKVGDWVTMKVNGKKTDWQIVGLYRFPGNTVPPIVYANYDYFSRAAGMPNQVYSLRVVTFDHDVKTQETIALQLQDAYHQKNIPVSYIQQGAVWISQQKSQTDVFVYFLLVMALLIATVGGLGLMSTMSLNVLERTREIGVMRAIGAADGDIRKIVVFEGLIIGLASWVLGFIFSFPITFLLDYGVGVAVFKLPIDPTFDWVGPVMWLGGIMLIATLASVLPAMRASKLSVRETLVYE